MNSTELDAGHQTALRLAESLKTDSLKIVLAESCTCGMASALLGSVPGISNYLCGSCVTYRVATKTNWLNLDRQQIERDSAESPATTRNMAINVLRQTPEATWSSAVTGDLGPNAGEKDGCIFVCVAKNAGGEPRGEIKVVREISASLTTARRVSRQIEAAVLMLQELEHAIRNRAQD